MMQPQKKVLVIGAGVIGQGWAIRFALFGWQVSIYDADPEALTKCQAAMERVREHVSTLYPQLPVAGEIRQVDSFQGTYDWVQESLPEVLEMKQACYAQLGSVDASVVASSTSGFKPSDLMAQSSLADRFVVCHPFNPVYLLPLVEVVPHAATSDPALQMTDQTLQEIGMRPLHVKKEIDAHIADRLLEAVWREALWLVKDGVATTADIDDAIKYGFGLRWAQMGMFETYRLGGGEAGMAHFMAQFGPALSWPWSRLTDVPELDEALVDKIVRQSDEQSADYSVHELAAHRDRNLVAIMQALQNNNWGVGEHLNRYK